MDHKHEWSKWRRYWFKRVGTPFGVSKIYTKQKESGTAPVWLYECLICHTVRHKKRKHPSR